MNYKVLVADPPWQFGDSLPGERGAVYNYQLMTHLDICRFPLPPLAPDATLFLWRVAAMQQEALDVVKAWGFTLKTEIVWLKRTNTGKRHFGMGRTVRGEHETCLIATKGRPVTLDMSVRSTFEAPTGEHSEKPEEFFKIVERLREGPYCELFARKLRDGWTCLGNEVSGGSLTVSA
jgi:N6-adenosine-specific RNA methylase IME4